jgi:hypothetical protein
MVENDYRSWDELDIDQLISQEERFAKINSIIRLGAKTEYFFDEEFPNVEELDEFIFDNSLYESTCLAEEPKEKYHCLKIIFDAPFKLLDNSEFNEMINSNEIVAVYSGAVKIDLSLL